MRASLGPIAAAALLLSACEKKETPAAAPAPATSAAPAPAPAPAPATAPAPAPTPAPPDPATAWIAWEHPKKLISAKFPGKPEQSDEEAPTAIGPVKFTMAIRAEKTRGFMAGALVYDLPEGTSFDKTKALDGA